MKYLEQHCKTKIKRIQLSHCHIYSFRYEVGSIPSLLYIASGGSLDWALGEAEIPYSFGNILIKDFCTKQLNPLGPNFVWNIT